MSNHLRHFIKYQFPAIGWALLIFIGSSIPSKYFPASKIFSYDKLIHIVLFFIFGVLVYRAFTPFNDQNGVKKSRLIFSILIVVGYGIFDEFHQGLVPGRSLDFYDGVADTVGGLLAAGFVILNSRLKNRVKASGKK